MVTHYRWDFIGLSTDSKPTPATSEKVADGSTYYESDTSKLYVWYDDQWYEKTAGGGGEGGDGIVELTTSDYDWPVSTPDGVALWKLDTGIYKASAGTKLYVNSNDKFTLGEGVSVLYDVSIISDTARIFSTYLGRSGTSNVNRPAIAYTKISDGSRAQIADISYLYGRSNEILMARDIYDALTQSNPKSIYALSAYQGYLLDQKIQAIDGVKELTEADYNYPTDNPTAIAIWLLEPNVYKIKYTDGVQPKIVASTNLNNTFSFNDGALMPVYDAFNNTRFIFWNLYTSGVSYDTYLIYSNGSSNYVSNFIIDSSHIVDALDSTLTNRPLSAKQGKVLNDKITAIENRLTAGGL